MSDTNDSAALKSSFDSVCYVAGKSVGKIPLAGDVVSFLCSRVKARWRYMELHPLLMMSLKTHGRLHMLTKHLVKEITATASFGAKRHNFVKYYVTGNRLLKLPKDPRDIAYGHW